jgi:hypothetical protein
VDKKEILQNKAKDNEQVEYIPVYKTSCSDLLENLQKIKWILEKSISLSVDTDEEELEKAYYKNGVYTPQHSDPEGMQHPHKPDQVKTTRQADGEPAWTLKPEIAAVKDQEFDKDVKAVMGFPRTSKDIKSTYQALANTIRKDPDRHVIGTQHKNGEDQFLRLRHVSGIIRNSPEYSMTPHPDGGFAISASRHSGSADSDNNIHHWHFNKNGEGDLTYAGKTSKKIQPKPQAEKGKIDPNNITDYSPKLAYSTNKPKPFVKR